MEYKQLDVEEEYKEDKEDDLDILNESISESIK